MSTTTKVTRCECCGETVKETFKYQAINGHPMDTYNLCKECFDDSDHGEK